jgi:thiamine-phosphate pyrophosphorylase
VYLVTDRHQTRGRELVDVVRQAVDAGVRSVQLREKDLSTRDLYQLAEKLLPVIRAAGGALLINDRIDIVMALEADGVHLTRRSLPPRETRDLLGPARLIGVSCHSLAEVEEGDGGGADFIVLGPIYATPSKAAFGPPLTPDGLLQVRSATSIPILAIGGIGPPQVPAVMAAGADGVAVISTVMAAPDPGAAATELLSAVSASRRLRQEGN